MQGGADPDPAPPCSRTGPSHQRRLATKERAGWRTKQTGGQSRLADRGIVILELSTHFQGQLVSVHPACDLMFDRQVDASLRGNPDRRRHWVVDQVKQVAVVSRLLDLTGSVSFTGSLARPYFYPHPQRPDGVIEECFAEQGRPWRAILDLYEDNGVHLCFAIHPTEDTFDGDTFEMFMAAVGGRRSAGMRAATTTMAPATSSGSAWIIWGSSTPITSGSGCFL